MSKIAFFSPLRLQFGEGNFFKSFIVVLSYWHFENKEQGHLTVRDSYMENEDFVF